MTQKEFLEELEEATHAQEKLVAKVKSHGLPVMIFGAGNYAVEVTKILNKYGLEVAGYAVDEEYYQPNQIYFNRPVYNFTELYRKPKDQVFFVAMRVNWNVTQEVAEMVINRRLKLFKDDNIVVYDFLHPGLSGERITYAFVLDNKNKFWEMYNMLSDDVSKKTMLLYLKSHMSGTVEQTKEFVKSEQYFNEFTRPAVCDGKGVYVDCGAYIGDTVERFVRFVNGKYQKVFALEPSEKCFSKLKNLVESKGYDNISCLKCGAWKAKSHLSFSLGGTESGVIIEGGADSINVDTIDNIVGDGHVSLIKMDIEGSELSALNGAIEILNNSRPTLALSAYHRKEDLITLPWFIKNTYKNCKFYLRKHHCYDLLELVLYVIPE